MDRRLSDVIPTRREVLKWGGLALAGSWVSQSVWPLEVHATGKANPLGIGWGYQPDGLLGF